MFKNIDSQWMEFRLWLQILIIIVSIIINITLFSPLENYLYDIEINSNIILFCINALSFAFFVAQLLFIISMMIKLIFWLLKKLKY